MNCLFVDLTEAEVREQVENVVGTDGYTVEPDGYGYIGAIGDDWLPDNYKSEDRVLRLILAELIGEKREYFHPLGEEDQED